MSENKVLEIKNLVKTYGTKGFQTKVLKGLNLTVNKHDFIAIMGPSGSGKTTLLNIRKDKIGFIFQDYNLLDTMTLQDNIALPLSLNGVSSRKCIDKTDQLANMFGLKEHLNKYPYQLSGGQKQRGATCRALITNPEIIFADEPTGALDSKSSHDLLECLKLVNDNGQATILMVTHDAFSASYAKEVYILSDGAIKCKLTKGQSRKEFYDRIIDMQASMGSDFS